MNKWNRLLAMLDDVFGFDDKVKSHFKKLRQDFDEKTNEHVFIIEYRIQTKDTVKSRPPKKPKSDGKLTKKKLLHQINTIAQQLR